MYYGTPPIVTNGLVLYLDAANSKSYVSGSTTWRDVSGNRNSGSLVGGPTFDSGNGGSIVFDGNDDYVNCGNNSSLNSITTYTVSTWLKLSNSTRNYNPIFCRHSRGTTSSDIEIYGSSNGVTLAHNRNNGGVFSFFYSNALSSNTIVMFSLTFAANTWTTYINGNLSQTIPLDQNGIAVPNPLVSAGYVTDIGQFFAAPIYYIQGNIYNQTVYNRALSAQEILQNYNATKTRFNLT